MAGKRKPGSLCATKQNESIDPGTLCRQTSGLPGPIAQTGVRRFSNWAATEAVSAGPTAYGSAKSLALELLQLLPVKPQSPMSLALLRHYVEGSGETYELGPIPEEWQTWIVKATKGRIGRWTLDPYNSGLYDLRNSLGHFDVAVADADSAPGLTYRIEDTYEFGFIPNDKKQRGHHGFPLSKLSKESIERIRQFLPDLKYRNPGGFTEKWELKKAGKETVLHIPQEFLARVGVPFKVRSRFSR